ncbi:archaemetzincin family Zn-dependent metalloprotease [Hymenobacter saemangeumensis]|uniref:Archaemetzincin family Zn-dependent metalloprotease n=1 Tax=Hymenobacter saemangeumensis TaxID=1084522 RepID=A0ABP8IPY1_9BACT
MRLYGLLILALALMSGAAPDSPPQVICLLPFAGITPAQTKAVEQAVAAFYGLPVAVLPPEELPASALCPVRRRPRAAVVLDSLHARFPSTPQARTKVLALTTEDIELEDPPQKPHWGVFGLANRVGGNECIASTFRLGPGRTDRLIKVCLHELGHTLHLPHCTSASASCLMRDAGGKVATVDAEKEYLCEACRAKLRW